MRVLKDGCAVPHRLPGVCEAFPQPDSLVATTARQTCACMNSNQDVICTFCFEAALDDLIYVSKQLLLLGLSHGIPYHQETMPHSILALYDLSRM